MSAGGKNAEDAKNLWNRRPSLTFQEQLSLSTSTPYLFFNMWKVQSISLIVSVMIVA